VRAFLLAGGKGERLRPLTASMPKCLVPIRGTPLLGIWLDAFARQGIDDVLVNVSQFPEQVEDFVEGRAGRAPRVVIVREAAPLGSAGTVAANRAFVDGEESFWIVYSDNLTNAALAPMLAFHRVHRDVLTMALFRTPEPQSSGVVSLDPDGSVTAFHEKPERPSGNLASAGIYLARQALFESIPRGGAITDFGHDVLPLLAGRMRGYEIEGYLADIGTPARLARAEAEWPGF
jgi:mannose-1-phosphate guanylyltransferase